MKAENRLEWVDSLRGLAALGVAIMHIYVRLRDYYPSIPAFQENSLPGLFILDFTNLGKICVVVFFLISGYVIPYSLFNKDLNQFAISRFFRLYPAYWVSIMASIMVIGFPPLIQLFTNITMLQKFVGQQDIIGVFWTLQIELIFYFICALMFYSGLLFNQTAILRAFYSLLGFSFVLASIRFITDIKLPVVVPLGLDVMLLGLLYRRFEKKEGSLDAKKMLNIFAIFIILLLPISFMAYNKDYGFGEKWYKYFVSYSVAILIFVSFSKYKWHTKTLVYLGAISYSLYLLHPVIGMDLVDIIKKQYITDLSPVNCILLFFLFSFGASMLSYHFVEKPSITMGRNLLKKIKINQGLRLRSG
ncbi:MAG: acyltransferase [Sphingobacteriales bacterium]|nr:acyltransferase [Sphingobacteriales bacterium]